MRGYKLTSQKKIQMLILTQTHMQKRVFFLDFYIKKSYYYYYYFFLRAGSKRTYFHLQPWWPCSDESILKLGKAASQFLHQAPIFCERPHDDERTHRVGYGNTISHFHVVVADDMEAPYAVWAENASWSPCFDVTIGGNCIRERSLRHNFTIYGLRAQHFPDSVLLRSKKWRKYCALTVWHVLSDYGLSGQPIH